MELKSNFEDSLKCGEIYLINAEYLYCCLLCDEKYKCSEEFSNHIQMEHNTTNQQPTFNTKKSDLLEIEIVPELKDFVDDILQENEHSLHNPANGMIINIFHCQQCEKSFKNELGLINHEKLHINTHTEDKLNDYTNTHFKKPLMKLSTSRTSEISNDIIINDELKCNYCPKILKSKQGFIEHTNKHLGIAPYKCDNCDRTFQHSSSYSKHKKIHLNKIVNPSIKLECKYCYKGYSTEAGLKIHEKLHTGELNLTCKLCNKSFSSKTGFKGHLVVHSGIREYKCDICSFSFYHKDNLRTHMQRHRGEKKFSCQYCEKKWHTFIQKRDHEITHTGEKPLQCEQCGKGFTQQNTLNDHLKNHENKREFICDICKKGFNTNTRLREHKFIHAEKTIKCLHCEKCFTSNKLMKQHRQIHINDKKYVCEICNKSFAQFAGLYSHKKMH